MNCSSTSPQSLAKSFVIIRQACTTSPSAFSANGTTYRTRAAQFYPPNMNAVLANALLALLPATAAILHNNTGRVDKIDLDIDDIEGTFNLNSKGDADDIELAMGLKTHGDNNPTTCTQAMRSDQANQLVVTRPRTEMQNVFSNT
eukprot:5841145-Pleurochrysis_carterae.AAC.1